jgi:hypothetical protein
MGTEETNLPKLAAPARRALQGPATPALRTSLCIAQGPAGSPKRCVNLGWKELHLPAPAGHHQRLRITG